MNKELWHDAQAHLADTHCHLQAFANEAEVYDHIAESGITVHQVTSSPAEYARIRRVADQRATVHAAVGLIPQEVRSLAGEVDRLCDLLHETRYVGEVGLDYVTRDEHDRKLQRKVFEHILTASAERGDCIITVHSRRAQDDVLAMVGTRFPGQVILHWFSGTEQHILQAGQTVWFSLNTAMATSKRSRELIACMPPDRILLETDGPYIQLGDRAAEPRDLHIVVERLMKIWACPAAEVIDRLEQNYQTLTAKPSPEGHAPEMVS